MNKTIETKFGTANIGSDGYYRITSYKEGNHSKKLHRLIFEDFYNINFEDVFKDFHVHHIDGDKLNNDIWNLELISPEEHAHLHHKGKILSEETKQKISESNKGRIFSDEARKNMSEAHKGNSPSMETRKKLSEAIKGEKNYWYGKHFSEEHKRKLSEAHKGKSFSDERKRKISEANKGKTHTLESKLLMSKNKNKTGIYNVFKLTNNQCKQGFTWAYYYNDENGKRRILSSVNLNKLKEKVLKKGLNWYELKNGEWIECN